jgi:hypothetical protein
MLFSENADTKSRYLLINTLDPLSREARVFLLVASSRARAIRRGGRSAIISVEEVMTMESGVTTPNTITRNTQREVLPLTFTAVDEKRFESEIKRIDATLTDERKNREKFESEVLKRFDKVDVRFDKLEKSVDVRFERMEGQINELRREGNSHFLWMMGVLVVAVLIPIALQYFAK